MTGDALTDRALNRATLARQLLLQRSTMTAVDAVGHLVGLQAQIPLDPYLALWSRLDGFEPHEVGRLIESRALVRIVVMRGTIHLVTADDALSLRPLMQPVLDAEIARHAEFAPHLVAVDLAPVLAFARKVLAARPLTAGQLRAELAERFPDLYAGALAYACRCLLPLVQVPPRGVWEKSLQVTSTPLESWVGRPLSSAPSIERAVLRYFAAFGPATVADVSAWSRLSGLRQVVERLRPQLRRSVTAGDASCSTGPTPRGPIPTRRRRCACCRSTTTCCCPTPTARASAPTTTGASPGAVGPIKGSVLVDGCVRAVWHAEHDKKKKAGRRTLVVEHVRLAGDDASEVEAEAWRAVGFLHPSVRDADVRLVPIG